MINDFLKDIENDAKKAQPLKAQLENLLCCHLKKLPEDKQNEVNDFIAKAKDLASKNDINAVLRMMSEVPNVES